MSFKEAMMRSVLLTVSPADKTELYMLADALRMFQQHPELRSDVVAGLDVNPERMITRIGMAMALVKWGVEPAAQKVETSKDTGAGDE